MDQTCLYSSLPVIRYVILKRLLAPGRGSFPDHHLSLPKIYDGHRNMIRVMASDHDDICQYGNGSPRRLPQTGARPFFRLVKFLIPPARQKQ